jgi:hypothetical protein
MSLQALQKPACKTNAAHLNLASKTNAVHLKGTVA